MRDLELRGAGDLLGDEQSGHVAAIGFELYVALLDEAVEAAARARASRGGGRRRRRCGSTSTSTPTCPPTTSRSRRRRSTSTGGSPAPARPGELRALRDELRDRFGPVPEPVENLLALQRARIELGAAGARTAEVRGGRLSIIPLELDAATVGRAARADPGGDLRAAHPDALAARRRRARRAPRRACSS